MNLKIFHDLDISSIKNSLVLIDVDGTVTYDGGEKIDDKALEKIEQLTYNNHVVFCSNSVDQTRIKNIAKVAKITHIETIYKKPNKKIINDIIFDSSLRLIVVGDKFLTDGRFARNIKGEFIKVKRLTGEKDSFYVRLINLIDDIVYIIVSKIHI